MCVNIWNEPPNIMVAIFIPSARLRPFHHPGVYVTPWLPQQTVVPLIHRWITPSSWIIRALVPSHAERNSACVSSTDHGHLAQYGCDGTHKEAGRGRQLVEPANQSSPHPVVWLWIWGTIRLQLGQEGALYAGRMWALCVRLGESEARDQQQTDHVSHFRTQLGAEKDCRRWRARSAEDLASLRLNYLPWN